MYTVNDKLSVNPIIESVLVTTPRRDQTTLSNRRDCSQFFTNV